MKIKKGDTVEVITGKDKAKTGKVLRAFPRDLKIVVEGVNIRKRHQRSKQQGKKGQIVELAHPIHVSNVKLSVASEAPAKKPKAKKAAAKK